MDRRVAGFDWDRANREKCRRHGVSIAEIESIFANPVAVVPDPAHSRTEERFKAIGRTTEGRHAFVVFTLRNRDGAMLIRPISARYMHRKEVQYYEKAAAGIQNR
jgi:uncharacterized DUF497 family protein